MRFFVSLILFTGSGVAVASQYDDEVQCLALNIYHEARGEPEEGQIAVALVTMNRVGHENYPDTVCAVVWQRGQFSWTRDGRSDRPRDIKAWQKSREIAMFVYNRYSRLSDEAKYVVDVTNGAIYYFAPLKAKPYWARHKKVTRKIGAHVFLREKS